MLVSVTSIWAKRDRSDMENLRGFEVEVFREGEWFVARCLGIELASQGRTRSEAMASLEEALELYLEKS
ncbi:MAG: hypothetical protein M3198_00605 [Actinomycetota bacterium]|nr:hypothetical protein [Actinomycetota bacterium]